MIRLRSRNVWVRMARSTYSDKVIPPDFTNVCSVFWRGLFGFGIIGAFCAWAGVILAAVISELIYLGLAAFLLAALKFVGTVIGMMVALALFGVGVGALWNWRGWRTPRMPNMPRLNVKERVTNTVPAQAFKSWKERHCALVRIED